MSIKKLIPAILIGTLACVNIAGCTSSKTEKQLKLNRNLSRHRLKVIMESHQRYL